MRVVFMGSPRFALPSLQSLAKLYTIVAVVSQPDRPAGRGKASTAPAIKAYAVESSLPVLQPRRIGEPDSISAIADLKPELLVVAAYGQILPQSLLDIPSHGALNVHASLLPRWRGAAPIQAAIRHGDTESGVTIMVMDAGLDTGPILSQRSVRLDPDETGGSLSERLSQVGAELLLETLPPYLSGELKPQPQDDSLASHAPMLKKSDGALDLRLPASELVQQIYAFDPWPGSFIIWDGNRLAIKRARVSARNGMKTGEVVLVEGTPAIPTQDGLLILETVQPAGKREMSAKAFVRGAPHFIGTSLLD